jgi:hypothetical protein
MKMLLIIVAAAVVAVVVVAAFLLMKPAQPSLPQPGSAACTESWSCTEWSACSNSLQTRSCTDINACGTSTSKPSTTQACPSGGQQGGSSGGTVVAQCKRDGEVCSQNSDCCNYCVLGTCKASRAYCGDSVCGSSENCSSCSTDCGACQASSRELDENVFTKPLGIAQEQGFKDNGYAIVRYFYSADCSFCYYPVNIEQQLRGMAADLKDLMVLVVIDTTMYKSEASKYAAVGGTIYKPSIRVDGKEGGKSGYDLMFGNSLGLKLEDGDITADVAPLICKHSDYCSFEGGRIVRA